MLPAVEQSEQPEQWCAMLFGKYRREESVVRSIKEVMSSLTDWKTTRSD